jgi:caffeoyl-CoA O-methyltransferase
MRPLIAPAIERYARSRTAPESPLFKALVRETRARTSLPQMQVGQLEGAFLRLMVRLSRARRVLEIGTFTGYSALAMAEGLPPGGRLVTCDVDPEATAIARRFWAKSPHGRKIELRLGPALETIRTLRGPFDLVFIDADKTNYPRYWEACVPKVRRGGLLLADNVLWSGRVLNPKDASDRALAAFSRRALRDRRVEPVLLTIRDGILAAVKR